jgi:hypothetical protein
MITSVSCRQHSTGTMTCEERRNLRSKNATAAVAMDDGTRSYRWWHGRVRRQLVENVDPPSSPDLCFERVMTECDHLRRSP